MKKKTKIILIVIGVFIVITCAGLSSENNDSEKAKKPEEITEKTTSASEFDNRADKFVDSTETEHMHSYSPVSCTEDSVCSCGDVKEKAKGHSWKEATCISAKKCTFCGMTDGNANGHSFSDGKCIVCDASDPDYVWVPVNGGEKYHRKEDCSQMENPQHVTITEAEQRGLTPCARCHP